MTSWIFFFSTVIQSQAQGQWLARKRENVWHVCSWLPSLLYKSQPQRNVVNVLSQRVEAQPIHGLHCVLELPSNLLLTSIKDISISNLPVFIKTAHVLCEERFKVPVAFRHRTVRRKAPGWRGSFFTSQIQRFEVDILMHMNGSPR